MAEESPTLSSVSYLDEQRVGFSPDLCSANLLLPTGCPRLLSSSGLHCYSSTGFTGDSKFSEPQLMVLVRLHRATAFLVPYRTAHGTQKLYQPFIRNQKPEMFMMHLPSADAHGPVNSRTSNLHTLTQRAYYYILLPVLRSVYAF